MAQAKTLTKAELKKLFDVTRSCSRYAERDLTMLQLTLYCGMRVGEVASLLVGDVLDADGMVSVEIVLAAHSTKSKRARRIFVPRQMQRQLQKYIYSCFPKLLPSIHLFSTKSRLTLQQTQQHNIYKDCMHRQQFLEQLATVDAELI